MSKTSNSPDSSSQKSTVGEHSGKRWQFWIDRGGTFTDIVARHPDGSLSTHKLLSENPEQYSDAAIQGIRDCMAIDKAQPIPVQQIDSVRMGTTVATNALLEHKGAPVVLVTTRGFADALRIAYQQRPTLFALDIKLPEMLYREVIEVTERVRAGGTVETELDVEALSNDLQQAYDKGLRSAAIVFMHAWCFPQHELQAAKIATDIGFTQVSISHQASSLIKFVGRGDTTVVDAYLSPVLHHYINRLSTQLPDTQLLFMQSSGGLANADFFQGKDAILSGPAGGVVGMVKTATSVDLKKLIGFDMGGTSTDVCHYSGEYERTLESMIAGVRIRAPMMHIHTVAAGGSSVLHFDGQRFRVGPDSAGADPGPVAYRRGGPLTMTDCNIMLGKLQADYFPQIFGEHANQPLDTKAVHQAFLKLSKEEGLQTRSVAQIAEGFLQVAVQSMANAIKKISLQRGYDVTEYALCCFGGASGQHAYLVAEALGMKKVFLHPFAGVLSAYGMGLAELRKMLTRSIEARLEPGLMPRLQRLRETLTVEAETVVRRQSEASSNQNRPNKRQHTTPGIVTKTRLHCSYEGSDSRLLIDWHDDPEHLRQQFECLHQQRYGFISAEKKLHIASLELEAVLETGIETGAESDAAMSAEKNRLDNALSDGSTAAPVLGTQPVYMKGQWQDTRFYQREELISGAMIKGPAVIVESTGTVVIEPDWQAVVDNKMNLLLTHEHNQLAADSVPDDKINEVDPVQLEIFNNLFMSLAEQMGFVLEQTAISVNIKERLDFSCAIFDAAGNLVANAPHMPVHLGSMSESIKAVIRDCASQMAPGDAYVMNDPYNGGTHLPDITVIKPVFDAHTVKVIFYVASRGHHADIGGITPGSIPPHSQAIHQEGILIKPLKLLAKGEFQEAAVRDLLSSGDYPARNIEFNIADLKAQLAACAQGENELQRLIAKTGLLTVQSYMRYVQDNAEESVRRVIARLSDGKFCYAMDDGSRVCVKIRVNRHNRSAVLDFTGTSEQHKGNFNAPTAITRAAVLYVFRCLVEDNIPLNEGCLKPLKIKIPPASLLNPEYPAAVVAGNVETSQLIVDTLFGALGVKAAAQGTMNNVTWGNQHFQYYETLCGGDGASQHCHGASAVHTHMTNSRLTDPEILENRFPVMLEHFALRRQSGGNGYHRGGDGVVRLTRFLEPMTVSVVSGHRETSPYGVAGGSVGLCGENALLKADGVIEQLPAIVNLEVQAGDTLVVKTPGGGGYGKVTG